MRAIDSTTNFLYVSWRGNPGSPNEVTHLEYYDLTADPNQMQSTTPPTSSATQSEQTPSAILTNDFEELVNELSTCAGEGCLDAEQF